MAQPQVQGKDSKKAPPAGASGAQKGIMSLFRSPENHHDKFDYVRNVFQGVFDVLPVLAAAFAADDADFLFGELRPGLPLGVLGSVVFFDRHIYMVLGGLQADDFAARAAIRRSRVQCFGVGLISIQPGLVERKLAAVLIQEVPHLAQVTFGKLLVLPD